MAEIRPAAPGLTGTPAAPARAANPSRTAAQRAFFQQALGQTQAPSATPAIAAAKPQPQSQSPALSVQRVVEQPVEGQPQRYLRPGSLLDIKV